MNDLDSLLVLLEVYGPLRAELDKKQIWTAVSNVEVLRYLLDNGILTYNLDGVTEALLNGAGGDVETFRALLDMTGDDLYHGTLVQSLIQSSLKGYLANVELLLSRDVYTNKELFDSLIAAIKSSKIDVARLLLATYRKTRELSNLNRTKLIWEAAEEDNVEMMKLLGATSEYEWEEDDVLSLAIEHSKPHAVKHILSVAGDKIFKTKKRWMGWLLVKAASQSDVATFSALLSDKNIDPMYSDPMYSRQESDDNLSKLIKATKSAPDSAEKLLVLIRSPKLRTEKLTAEQVKQLYMGNDADLLARMQNSDLIAQILRFIVLKQPTDRELLDWMISLKDKDIMLAARLVLGSESGLDVSSTVNIVRGLLLSLLYPTMTLDEVIDLLYDDGYSRGEIDETAMLIGAYIGERLAER
jgi:hypothetical protein